jgi:NAD(P)-dependent dehydrogenase (short-subunit alcohol dehydrogenase family)
MQEHTAEKSARLKGQVALVTGGGRGIGRTIAQTLAGAGAAVAVLSRSNEELSETVHLLQQAGGRAAAFPADVTDAQAIQSAIRSVEQSFGPIDVLVNNAGTPKPLAPFAESDLDEWWRGFEVNLLGPAICTRHVLQSMISRGRGRIINLSSGAGAMAMTHFSSYVCSKTALVRFTECLALENVSHGIAVFAIAPGTVRTAMSEYSLNSREGQKFLPWFRRLFDEGFTVPPEHPAALVLELASGRADALSGRFISIYDDLEQLIANAADLQQNNLHVLKVERLAAGAPNPALASIMAASRRVAD